MGDDLKVPKRAIAVDLLVGGGEPRRVELFLAEHREHAFGREQVLDLLEEAPPFLPAHDLGERGWLLVNKAHVVWAALPATADAEPEGDDEPLFDQRRAVRIELTSGPALDGKLLYSAPPGRARLSDYLNGPGRFLRVFTGERLYLVNKAFVTRALERDGGGRSPQET